MNPLNIVKTVKEYVNGREMKVRDVQLMWALIAEVEHFAENVKILDDIFSSDDPIDWHKIEVTMEHMKQGAHL